MLRVEKTGQEVQIAIKLLDPLHKLPDPYSIWLLQCIAYVEALGFGCVTLQKTVSKWKVMQSIKDCQNFFCSLVCSTPNKSVRGVTSICSPRILLQGLLASSVSRLEYNWNTWVMRDLQVSFLHVTASVAFCTTFFLGGLSSLPL